MMDMTYIILDMILFVTVCLLYANTSLGIIKTGSLRPYRILLLITIVMVLADILCRSSYDLYANDAFVYSVSCLFYALVSLAGIVWAFTYFTNVHTPVEKKELTILLSIPLLTVLILEIISYWTDWFLTSDNCTGTLYPLFIVILALPILIAMIHAAYLSAVAKTDFKRKNSKKTIVFFIFPLFCFVLQAIWNDVPFISIGFVFGIVAYHFDMQNETARSDPNSNINNRLTLNRYLRNTFDDCKNGREKHLFVAFGDMDRFGIMKHKYGKETTDIILFDLCDILMDLSTSDFFPGYNDGDEFVFIITSDSYEKARAHIDRVYAKIAEYDEKQEFTVHMSIGLIEYKDQTSPEQLLTDADEESKKVKEKYYSDNGFVRGKA